MMTQEEFVDVKGMRAAGMTYAEIAEATGYHRTTIAKWIANGGPPERRAPAADRVVLTDRWRRRIAELLEERPALLSTSIHDVLVAEGFTGSYATVVRAVRAIRGPRFKAARAASVPIETAPGAEAQFDFCDVSGDAALGQTVEVHHPVDSSVFIIRWAGQIIATHRQAPSGADDVWDLAHHADAVHAALTAATGRHLHPVPPPPPPELQPDDRGRLAVGDGYDVAIPDLTVYGDGCGCTGQQ